MILTLDQLDKFVGQIVKDEYGRVLGKLVMVYSNVSGEVESIELSINDVMYESVSASRIKLTPDGLVIIPEWKTKALDIENKLDRVKKRLRATEDLYRKGIVPVHAYEELKKKLEVEFRNLKEEVRKVKELLRRRAGELEDLIIRLEKDLTNLQVLYMSNEFSESSYKIAADVLRNNRTKSLDEKRDVEKHLELISKLETEAGEIRQAAEVPQQITTTSPTQTTQPTPKAESPIQVQVIDTA